MIAVLLILLISGFSLISYDLFSARFNFCSDAGTYAHGNHRASHAIPNPASGDGAHLAAKWRWRLSFFVCATATAAAGRGASVGNERRLRMTGWIGSGGLAWTPYTPRAASPTTACAQQHWAGMLQPVLRAPLGRDLAVN